MSNEIQNLNLVFGLVGLVLYYGASTIVWGRVACRILPLSRAWARIFGFLLSFYLSAIAAGIPVVLWKYEQWLTGVIFLIVLIVGLLLSFWSGVSGANEGIESSMDSIGRRPVSWDSSLQNDSVKFSKRPFLLFGIFSIVFVWLLARARTGGYILSPWDILSPLVLVVFFIITFLVVRLIFSKQPVKIVLAAIIVFSYLTHLYLPLVYKTGFGGDKWRHLGAERWLASGQIVSPAKHAIVWGEEKGLARLLAVDKISYTPMWTATIFLAESLGVDIFWIDLVLVFLLWSFFLPLILYQFGRLIFAPLLEETSSPFVEGSPPATLRVAMRAGVRGGFGGVGDERLGLLFAFLPILFANFQIEGAITLPVSFSHLFFFFTLLLWAYFVKTGRRSTLVATSLLTLFSYWGYVLNFIVLIIIGALALFYRFFVIATPPLASGGGKQSRTIGGRWPQTSRYGIFVVLAAAASFILPFLEVGQGLSKWKISPFPAAAFVNFIYHSTVSITVVSVVVAALIWIAILYGLYKLFRSRHEQKSALFLAVVFIVILASYFISWTFTEGERILARRLPETIIFLMILFLGRGIISAYDKIGRRGMTVAIGLVLALAATSTYSSRPTSELVTSDQLAAAELVWSEIKDSGPPYCVIANTWPLLALEAVSGERVIGGGFPIVAPNYQQPERVRLFKGLSQNPKMEWFEEAFAATGASACYYINEPRWLNRIAASNTTYLLGPPRRVGETYVWRVAKSDYFR